MDNLDKIKFKESTSGWLFKIDASGKTEFKIGTRFVDELKAWEKAGYTIEPQLTAKELTAKKKLDAESDWQATKSTCIRYLNESEIHVSTDPPYPDSVQDWKVKRAEWRVILKSGTTQEVPEKPFGGQ